MSITITRNNERIATYHYKRTTASLRAVKGVLAFYQGLYPHDNITAKRHY